MISASSSEMCVQNVHLVAFTSRNLSKKIRFLLFLVITFVVEDSTTVFLFLSNNFFIYQIIVAKMFSFLLSSTSTELFLQEFFWRCFGSLVKQHCPDPGRLGFLY